MKKTHTSLTRRMVSLCLMSVAFSAYADAKAQTTELQLCGQGTLSAFIFFNIGEASMYRENCDAPWTLEEKEARRLVFKYNREVPAKAFREASENFLSKNSVILTGYLKIFNAAYQDVKAGDQYEINLIPGKTMSLKLNNEELVNIPDSIPARQYFAIWLGDQPFDYALKKDLLGR